MNFFNNFPLNPGKKWWGTESPVEGILLWELTHTLGFRESAEALDALTHMIGWWVLPQYRIGRYRADFLLASTPGLRKLLVECDGKDFHSSPEQIEYDEARDYEIRLAGYTIQRFTGSQITHGTNAVLASIARYFEGDCNELMQKMMIRQAYKREADWRDLNALAEDALWWERIVKSGQV